MLNAQGQAGWEHGAGASHELPFKKKNQLGKNMSASVLTNALWNPHHVSGGKWGVNSPWRFIKSFGASVVLWGVD